MNIKKIISSRALKDLGFWAILLPATEVITKWITIKVVNNIDKRAEKKKAAKNKEEEKDEVVNIDVIV